jgi:hypothetical protein
MKTKIAQDTTFKKFSAQVAANWEIMSQGELYTLDVTKEQVWDCYLGSFPEGSNPIFRERTEHDCQCCRQFIVNIGSVVGIDSYGRLVTVWDNLDLHGPYAAVAEALSHYLKSKQISGVFRTKERSYGTETTWEHKEGQKSIQWDHFHGKIANKHFSTSPDADKGSAASTVGVYKRGLTEITFDALDTVIGLIEQEALYRGPEFLNTVKSFRNLKRDFLVCVNQDTFIWATYNQSSSRIKNSAIGTLLEDLSAGVDLEQAVRSFESKVAPTNYKRPKSLITPKMIKEAVEKIESLGLTNALQRRHAKFSDMSVNNVLFVDNSVRAKLRDNPLTDLLMEEVKPAKVNLDKAPVIDSATFFQDMLPVAKSVSVQVTGDMFGNFVSLTAPAIENSGRLFKWNNDFAWSYDGNITDSIKQRVKRAGGKVDAKLRVSLSWFNTDDLDIHVIEPNKNHVYFANKDGKLDVDMNAGSLVRDPVENVTWSDSNLKDGLYQVYIQNFHKRESTDVGFVVQMEFAGEIRTFKYDKPVLGNVQVVDILVQKGNVVDVKTHAGIESSSEFQDKWGVSIGSLCKVESILLSPNHWDGNAVGNKHWFFILENCKNPEPTRGIYNEFLSSELESHRKVLEILGDKTKCPYSDEQLSGIGFSSTLQHELPVVVQTSKGSKAYKIKF